MAAARVFAAFEHTLKQPGIPRGGRVSPFRDSPARDYIPGPLVYAIPSILFSVMPASWSAFLTAPGFRDKGQERTSKSCMCDFLPYVFDEPKWHAWGVFPRIVHDCRLE